MRIPVFQGTTPNTNTVLIHVIVRDCAFAGGVEIDAIPVVLAYVIRDRTVVGVPEIYTSIVVLWADVICDHTVAGLIKEDATSAI